LAIISACAGSLLRYPEGLTEEARRDLLQSIEHQSARLNHLTGNLLSLGRIEGGLDLARMAHIDALEVLGSALVTVRQLAPDRVITKELGLAEAIVRADPSMLEQVFINVLQNAVVHTPSKSPIHVGVQAGSNEVVIAVDDEGPGIAAEQRERIFERFQQAPLPGQRSPGSGLGLSIARGFARAVGGDVRLGRRPSGAEGARFEIRLPMAFKEAAE
jgi:two-component system sensor histidine kinase KdpD